MTQIESQLRNAIVILQNYANAETDSDDAFFLRQQITKMEAALPDHTRTGNLSPEYLLAADRFDRQSAIISTQHNESN